MDQVEIMSECVIKIENIKQEAADHAEEEAYNFMEGDGTFALKSEVEEGGEEEGDRTYPSREAMEEDDEEEIKPPFEVFLDPEEVPTGEVKQEQKDPLAMCNENFFGDSALPVGGEYETARDILDSRTQIRNGVCSTPPRIEGNYIALGKTKVEGSESPVRKDQSAEKESQFPKLNSAKRVHEQSVCEPSTLDGGCEGGNDLTRFKRRHMRFQSANRSHQCPLCQRSFTHRSNLVTHMRTHSGERPHKCPVCLKSFTQSSHLVSHMRIHSGERPHKCSVCEKSFTESSHLVRHMRVHSGDRPHKCTVCEKRFSESSSLVKHMRIHSGERPHKCSVCQKSFSVSSNLITHMRIHNGERPHKCSVCEKRFTHSTTLINHMRVHSGDRPHKCTVCQRRFSESSSLVKHMRIHSGDSPH
ncbi:hypothetical protein R5R35_002382 [Gryllus longicercus]|uniref:C2H2-type domain-containing protein n=1 Tax=Gryllus longicercus TaxID=2509291 RepID=A0AAN9YU12_9ORTH